MDIESWEEERLGRKEFSVFLFHLISYSCYPNKSDNKLFTVTVEFTVKIKSQNKITEVKVFTVFLVTVCQGGMYSIR